MNWEKFRITRWKKLHFPDDIIQILLKDKPDYEDALVVKKSGCKTKKYFYSVCEICKEQFKLRILKFTLRKHNNCICGKCYIPKFVTKTQEWKDNNSRAQLVAQNRPETKKQNADSVRRYWKNNPEKLAAMGQKISDRFFNDEKYRDAVSGSRYKGFIFCNKFGKIKFDSLFELSYVIQCDADPKIISLLRWTKGIPYIDRKNTKHRYYPDFVVNKTNVIELKGEHLLIRHKESIELKTAAFKQNYPDLRFQMISSGIDSKDFRQICRMNDEINVVFHNIKVNEEYLRLKEKYANKK